MMALALCSQHSTNVFLRLPTLALHFGEESSLLVTTTSTILLNQDLYTQELLSMLL